MILMLFVSINFVVATRTPTVGMDEAQHCDPAANLYFGSGYTSTMWGQARTDFTCCNDSLYQGILFCFFKIFGFSFFKARAVNTLLAAFGGVLIWAALRRANLVRLPVSRLICLALVLSGSVSTLTFRTNRYDTTMFFICSLVFFACSLPAHGLGRYGIVALSSAFLPAAGLPTVPYAAALLAINLLVYRSLNVRLLTAIAAGIAAGAAGLVLFYLRASSLRPFLEIVLPSTALSRQGNLARKILGTAVDPDNLFTCFFGNPTEFLNPKIMFDYSAALLFILVVLLALRVWKSADAGSRKFIIHAVAVTLLVPPTMHLAGHYRSYYRWMTYVPLCIATPRMLEIYQEKALPPLLERVALAGICLSLFMGVPLRSLAIVPRWSERSPKPMERVAAQISSASDITICGFKVYFAVRPHVKVLYAYGITATGEFSRTKDLPKDEITLLCVTPGDFECVTNIIGGKWTRLSMDGVADAEALKQTRYAVDFYRRASNP
jgi:hypothetical protein